MHMNGVPHLRAEDRAEFERVLGEALRLTATTPAARTGSLSTEQLRAMARSARAAISACAGAEYESYQRARERRRTGHPADSRRGGDENTVGGGEAVGGARAPMGGGVSGAGLFPVVAVLTPVLSGSAALIFLITGYVMSAMSPRPALAAPLRTAGWLFLAIAGAGILFCTIGMLLTALRDGSSAIHASSADGTPDELASAREAWSLALLERGMLPFLREALASGRSAAPTRTPPAGSEDVAPDGSGFLGFSSPGFSSPNLGGREHDR